MVWRNPRRLLPFLLGLVLFVGLAMAPPFPDTVDPAGQAVHLSSQGQAALGLFLLAGIWWVFEVVPVGVTAIAIAVFQSLWLIRDPRAAMTDFMDPSVWFIFGSLLIGASFTRTGLTRRLAFLMLSRLSERTNIIYLGVFGMTAALTLFMAHTAVAAAVFPLLLVVHNLYEPSGKVTRFGKGLFIGMAWTAGAGSIITLLGAARGAVALGFYQKLGGEEISFFELTKFMLPLGVLMVFLLWGYICLAFRPEKREVPGLRARAAQLYAGLGPVTRREIGTLVIVAGVVTTLSLRSFVPALAAVDKSAVILCAGLLFFFTNILNLKDLEAVPWNIVLLFGGAMSIGFCLWQTGAAEWMAIGWLSLLHTAPWFVFVIGVAFFVMIMTNFIMNVAAIAITLPVALVMARYIGVHPEVVVFASLAAAGMPFMLLVGAAPNAIAFESKMFRTREFFLHGIPASAMLMLVIALFVWKVWPMMGMPVLTG
ncbi:MAG: SLC13 family permease [Candidatus Krumholzibacteria bacterium]|nr:SLC13 family permease [Candidatus Krumholzibacteria bacterium]